MVSESDSKFLKFAEWFIWFLLGVTIVIGIWIGIYSDAEFADKLGSFLSGAFSPLAFLFVMLGYLKQVQSQKDTEDFLKKQSKLFCLMIFIKTLLSSLLLVKLILLLTIFSCKKFFESLEDRKSTRLNSSHT
mgnify:CR=1 FL=1